MGNKYDFIENLIFNLGLRIETVEVLPESDLFLMITNKKMILPPTAFFLCTVKRER